MHIASFTFDRCATPVLESAVPSYDDAQDVTWYEINDQWVRPCRYGEEERQKAYLLFYERVY